MQKPFKIECDTTQINTILTALWNELQRQQKGTMAHDSLMAALHAVHNFKVNS